jgi:aspartate racemase
MQWGMRLKKIGMIGGLSWVSTADYYKRLNLLVQKRIGGAASARIALESLDRQAYVDAAIGRQDERTACGLILKAAKSVERAGADFIVIACNDVHRFVPQMEFDVKIPFLHIAEAVASAIEERGVSLVALLGVRKTMEGSFYQTILAERGIETLVPDELERTWVHDTIYQELTNDIFSDATRQRYIELVRNLQRRGAEGVILACTEIPLLVQAEDFDIPSFSPNQLHCEAAVEAALRG